MTAWAPTQNPQAVQDIVATELGITKENVICHVTLLGGGFGRKSKPDYVAEAAVLAKKLGRPVKVVWTREDDIKFDYYNAVAAMYMRAALGADGKPSAWLQRSVFPPITSIFDVNAVYGDPGHLQQGWTDVPFDIPNLRVENGPAKAHVRIGWLRSVANIYHAFAVQTFADELAHAAGRDPLEYLLELIGTPRILNLKDTDYPNYGAAYRYIPWTPVVCGGSRRWSRKRPTGENASSGKGAGLGIAAHRSFLTYVASSSKSKSTSKASSAFRRVDTVVDAGISRKPGDHARAVRGRGRVRHEHRAAPEKSPATKGVINQSNFFDYPVARINEAPYQTNVHLVDGPTGRRW